MTASSMAFRLYFLKNGLVTDRSQMKAKCICEVLGNHKARRTTSVHLGTDQRLRVSGSVLGILPKHTPPLGGNANDNLRGFLTFLKRALV